MKKALVFLTLFLVACSDASTSSSNEAAAPVVQQEEIPNETANEQSNEQQEPIESEDSTEEQNTILEDVQPIPTTFEEIISYPVGPLSGNGYYAQLDGRSTLTTEQVVDEILKVMPIFNGTDIENPTYLDQWFNALYSLFAEQYNDPQEILDNYFYESFGQLLLDGKPIQFQDDLNVLFVLDASGSMLNLLNNETMISIAQLELSKLIDRLPGEVNIGFRTYGGQSADLGASCSDLQLVEPIAANNKESIKAALQKIEPKGSTPIAASLQQVAEDLKNYPAATNSNFIFLISDGIETCGGDPIAEAQNLSTSEAAPIINVIGFNVDGKGQQQLERIAEKGNGKYINALNKQSFTESLQAIDQVVDAWTKRQFEIWDDALEYRGEITTLLTDLNKQWREQNDDEYKLFMAVMDELLQRPDLIPSEVYGEAQSILLEKISNKTNVYREQLQSKHDELVNEIDAIYNNIIDSIK